MKVRSQFLLAWRSALWKNIPCGILILGFFCPLYRFFAAMGWRCNFDLMLEQFTWFDFFACAVPLIAAWYLWLFLVYKRSGYRIVDGLGGAAGSPVLGLEQNGGFNADLGVAADELDLMGKSKMPDGVSRIAASDVVFAVDEAGDTDNDLSTSVLIGDVLNELKEVFAILAKEDGSKADFFRLMVAVKESYPGLGSHPGLALLNVFVSEHAPFLLTLTELESLWD